MQPYPRNVLSACKRRIHSVCLAPIKLLYNIMDAAKSWDFIAGILAWIPSRSILAARPNRVPPADHSAFKMTLSPRVRFPLLERHLATVRLPRVFLLFDMQSGVRFRVVICGAGIGGLTAAVALSAYRDIDVEVYEAATELAEVGAGIGIFPRAWEVIRRLGLEDELLQYTDVKPEDGPVSAFRYRKSDQNSGLEFYTLVTNGKLMLFHRADFQQALLRRLPKTCQTHLAKRLRSYTQRPSGPVEILFDDGSTTACDVLIGADGLKSAVRRSFLGEKVTWARSEGRHAEVADIDASVDPVWTGILAYRALIAAEKLKSRSPDHPIFSRPTQYLGKNGYIIAYPIAHGKIINFVAFIARHDLEGTTFRGPWVCHTDRSEFTALFSHWETEVQDLIECVDEPLRWAVHTVKPLNSFISGRVALVGDAAHAMAPFQGSGAGQAVEDAYILSTLLGHPSTTRATLDHALRIFDLVRRPQALEVAENSRRNGQLFTLHDQVREPLAEDATLDRLRALSDEFTRIWEWAWTTSIDGSLQEALRLLES
ncbi:putative salicylate hydroxylase [Lyophyllum shimeji]|uniref:Salicylate hydroxylase n=1 Tax=Lyophyllum shimeji TaxID=47721 RepID=A0A9P3URK4_LYOSH|nr:putative salicylate hydroxylase [Lyophyllum shimeji]